MRLLSTLLFLFSLLYADEIKRIDSIVKDIEKLRVDYNRCSEMLDKSANLAEQNSTLLKKIEELENIVKKQEKLLKIKEKKDKNQFLYSKKCEKENSFPKLMMKSEYQEKHFDQNEITTFKASAFRLKTDSIIYDAINGNSIGMWEKGTSFTSNTKSDTWIKVSGYFVNRKWRKAKEEIWIRSAQVFKRD
ncbi:hypothetical protein [Sulfurimonas sp.]|uniref:hypothetical protein n=1 Tax=Sulfurimonas sp. TaxID=2022749 RepID=UPI0025DABBC0|nr:hypothetical protein [Sulfurimonas sp.]MCK9453642.1 hypothetical protein [Sulfurimonas sp.]